MYRFHTTTTAIYTMCNEHNLFTKGDILQYIEELLDEYWAQAEVQQ